MIDVSLYLDNANRPLWEEMSSLFNISVEYGKEKCYANFQKGQDCTIFVVKGEKPCPASFTHELLHLYLPSKQISIGGAIRGLFQGQTPHNLIFNKELYDHLSNSLSHIKMFPLFVQMGYPAETFLQDYECFKLTDSELETLVQHYKSGIFKKKYHPQAVNCFIGKFFAAKADVNPNNNYDKSLLKLKQIDPQLDSVLDGFWNSWVEYDVDLRREVWEDDYRQLVNEFCDGITEWGKGKNFEISQI